MRFPMIDPCKIDRSDDVEFNRLLSRTSALQKDFDALRESYRHMEKRVDLIGAMCLKLRESLHVVLGECELLLSDLDPDSGIGEGLRTIQEQVDRLEMLSRDLENLPKTPVD
jgi:signal transduction histidine kinase